MSHFIHIFHSSSHTLFQKQRNFSHHRNVILMERRWSSDELVQLLTLPWGQCCHMFVIVTLSRTQVTDFISRLYEIIQSAPKLIYFLKLRCQFLALVSPGRSFKLGFRIYLSIIITTKTPCKESPNVSSICQWRKVRFKVFLRFERECLVFIRLVQTIKMIS